MSSTVIGVYWSARGDDVSGCTEKALQHFRVLAQVPGLDCWFRKESRKPTRPIDVDVSSAEALMGLWQANRRDTDRTIISELGWSLALWNGEADGSSATTNLHCGCTSERVGNRAVVEVRREDSLPLEDATAIALLKGLVEIWNADTGTVYRTGFDEDQKCRKEGDIASYKRHRWPFLLSKKVVRHAQGIIKVAD